MEKHVTNLEISKKLKELGVKQKSGFWWSEWTKKHGDVYTLLYGGGGTREEFSHRTEKVYSAFLASELGELLPDNLSVKRNAKDFYTCRLSFIDESHDEFGKTMPDAMGKMLIYLLENNLLSLDGKVKE